MSASALTGYPEDDQFDVTVAEAIALARRVNERVAVRLRSWRRPMESEPRRTLDDAACVRLVPPDPSGPAFS